MWLKSTDMKVKVAASFSEYFSILTVPWVFFRTKVPPKCSDNTVQVISTLSPQFTSGAGLRVIWGFSREPETDNRLYSQGIFHNSKCIEGKAPPQMKMSHDLT